MYKLFKNILFILIVSNTVDIYAQCTVEASADPNPLTCGLCTELSAFGKSGVVAFAEDFNAAVNPSDWNFTQTVDYSNPCGPSNDGTPYMWMGDASDNPRDMETIPLDLTLGGSICFDLRFSIQADNAPCEGPDLKDEGVYLQYSTDGGNNWTKIHYFQPTNGGKSSSSLTKWDNYCFVIPAGAETANTMIRWHQDDVSGPEYDHWGIDNIVITLQDPSYSIIWNHDGYDHGPVGGINPNKVCPKTDQTYTVVMSNGVDQCSANVTVTVQPPTLVVDAGNDTTLCEGSCATLNSDVKVVLSPAGDKKFQDNTVTSVTSVLGSATVLPVNVDGLNMQQIQPGSIKEVCLGAVNYNGLSTDISTLNIILTCPSGQEITLLPSGVTTPGDYIGMCFTADATNTVAGGTSPYTGNWQSSDPFDNLVGCDANGEWSVKLDPTQADLLAGGSFWGWHIVFDDPEISYKPNITWSPTTDFQNPTDVNAAQPTICPNSASGYPITYTVTASDTSGCGLTGSDQVTVSIQPVCCLLEITDTTLSQPSCSNNDGSIQVVASNTGNAVTYQINDGNGYGAAQASDLFPGLSAGSYDVVVNDDTNCPDTLFNITLVSANAPTIDDTTASPPPSCGAMDGGIDVTASGGVPPLEYSSDGGATYQPGNVLTGLGAGTYDIRVRDANNCETSVQYTLNPGSGPTISNVASTPPSCGIDDGTITITATGGAGTLEYSIDNGGVFSNSNVFNALGVGTYDIVVRDAGGCTANDQTTLSVANGPTITDVTTTPTSCGANDGTVTVTASGGTGALEYSIDNGVTFVTNNVFNALGVGTYDVVVRDAGGCSVNDQGVVGSGNTPVFDNITFVNPACGANDGEIAVTASGGIGTLEYRIDNTNPFGTTTNYVALATGTYLIEVRDGNGCVIDSLVKLNDNSNMSISLNSVDAGLNCVAGCNGNAVILTNGGTAPYRYNWSDGIAGTSDAQANDLCGNTYSVTVSDDDGCSRDTTFTVRQLFPFTLPVVTTKPVSCEQNCDGEMTIITHPKFTLSFDGGATNLTTTQPIGLCDSLYNLMVTDTLGCDSTIQITIGVDIQPVADFSYVQDPNGDPFNPSVIFTNESQRSYFYDWDFGVLAPPFDGIDTTLLVPLNSGSVYPVCLTARDSSNCESIICKDVEVELVTTFYAPNTITVDGNNLNDGFLPVGIGWETLDYKLRVFDRWGTQLFETDDKHKAWNGKKDNTGKLVSEGVYVWEVELSKSEFKTQKYQGHVTVLVAQ